MKVCWNGGHSYSVDPATLDDVEDVAEALALCEDRERNRDGSTPCVEYGHRDAAAWLYLDPDGTMEDSTDLYPDHVVEALAVTDKAGAFQGYRFRAVPA